MRRLRWPHLWHIYGTPETPWHRIARVALYRVNAYFTWKWPKRLGLDNCSVCKAGPCSTKIGSEWRCPAHSIFVSRGSGAAQPGAALRVIQGGRSAAK